MPATIATLRGPTFRIHSPPTNAAMPRTKMAMVKVSVTCEMVQPNARVRGILKTLHAYTAPSAICMMTPAKAITQRLDTAPDGTTGFDVAILKLLGGLHFFRDATYDAGAHALG